MSKSTIPLRSEIAPEHTWNGPSVFETVDAWEAEMKRLAGEVAGLAKYQGQLGGSPKALAEALKAREALLRRALHAHVYAGMSSAVDQTNQAATAMFDRAGGLLARLTAAGAYIEPELLAIGEARLRTWLADRDLAEYAHYIDNLLRQKPHIRSAEVETVLGMLGDPFGAAGTTYNLLTNADMQFKPAVGTDGVEWPVGQGGLTGLLAQADREVRRTAWEHYADAHLAHKNTLASTLNGSIKQNILMMRARNHASSLEASLFENAIPVEVFHNLIDTFKQNLSTWHRYWRVRRKALGVDRLHPYDIWAPLTAGRPSIDYRQAVDWICEGLAPLGDDYVSVMRRGCLEDRWVDIYPNRGKMAGAFSWGAPGTHPFIMMSYDGTILNLSTLAHELGHSMHSYLAWKHQPFVYTNYSLFLAEVASNFHQAMVRSHLLATHADRDFQIGVIEEAMSNFHRYFLIMPTLARFELEAHQRVERGDALTADGLNELMADLFEEAYGGEMHVDRDRTGITWATFSHLYADYYVYQYATGIAGANAFARRILDGVPGAADSYLGFLMTGSSRYSLDTLRQAGVDLSTPAPIEAAFAVVAGLVDRLETLVAA